MSYCRFGWGGSEVYVYESAQGLECCGCWLQETGFTAKEPEEMIAHLGLHRRAGYYVPDGVIYALWEDIPGARRSKGEDPVFTKAAVEMSIMHLKLVLERLKDAPSSDIEEVLADLPDNKTEQ